MCFHLFIESLGIQHLPLSPRNILCHTLQPLLPTYLLPAVPPVHKILLLLIFAQHHDHPTPTIHRQYLLVECEHNLPLSKRKGTPHNLPIKVKQQTILILLNIYDALQLAVHLLVHNV